MKIDLCKIFGVEEGEEFKLKSEFYDNYTYRIYNNILQYHNRDNEQWVGSHLDINTITHLEIIKLPKKKQFTDDELCILRNIDKWYKWIARSRGNVIMLHNDKPYKDHNIWNSINCEAEINVFNHLFKSIQWEDEEPVFIDDYVERC